MVCDLAQTYHIFNYLDYKPNYIATLVHGLGHDSRVKRKMNGMMFPLETLLIANCADALQLLVYSKTKDASKGRNRPKSIVEALTEAKKDDVSTVASFSSSDDFEREKERILKGVNVCRQT